MQRTCKLRIVAMILALIAATLLPGCIKDTSKVQVEEVELYAATELSISNPLGNVKVAGAEVNNNDGMVYVKTEKFVDAYSLFGFASPDDYVNKVVATPTINDEGKIEMGVEVAPRSLFERLFVRIVPHVNRMVEAPTLISTDAEVQFGDMEFRNLPGDVNAVVSVGKVTADSPVGVVGEQRFDINVGELELRVPEGAGFEYDLSVDMGKAESNDFDLDLQHRFMGVRASGLKSGVDTPGLVAAKVNIGAISVKAR